MQPNGLLRSLLERRIRLTPSWWTPTPLHPHPRLNATDLARLRKEITNSGGDPIACGLPPPTLGKPSPVITPKQWPLWYLRKYQKWEYVQGQLAKMPDMIAEYRERRRQSKAEMKKKLPF